MSGINNGVQALILNGQPVALYNTHCFNHVLNLAISKACNIPAIWNMFGIVSSVSGFLSTSVKRNNILQNAISNDNDEPLQKKTKLRALCATRWVDRYDSIITFNELYKFILISLEELEKDINQETSVKASSFNSSVKKSEFVVIKIRHKNKNPITAKNLHSSFEDSNIYINDQLTHYNKKLLWTAKQVAKNYNFKYTWANSGGVFIRKQIDGQAFKISNLETLRKMDEEQKVKVLWENIE